jgi:hypothetical protein
MAIASLAKTAPDWVEFRQVDGREADIDAVGVRRSGAFTRLFELSVMHLAHEVKVYERAAKRKLPVFCAERHINGDGSFCLGLRAGEGITVESAPAWWAKLHAFLLCQETATESGLWPTEAELSHGEGGEIELLAERAANETGLQSSYREAVQFDTGTVASGLARINSATRLLRNGRSACICGRTNRTGKVLLRRDCHRLGCPIVLEYERRAAVDRFWRSMRNQQCCGTMRNCPLRARSVDTRADIATTAQGAA